jgi:ABC-2 type transport system permease protein
VTAFSARRTSAIMYRHIVLFRQSPVGLAELFCFAALQMLVWGFTATYIAQRLAPPGVSSRALGIGLVAGFLLWEMVFRSQVAVSSAFLEESSTRNLTHILASPIRPAEFVGGLIGVSLVRTIAGVAPAVLLAWLVYGYNILSLGPVLILLIVNLFVMGWWMAILVITLTLRFGAAAQGLAYSFTVAVTPLAAAFYPVAVLPGVLRALASALPASHIFEAMRALAQDGTVRWHEVGWAAALNVVWLAVASILMGRQLLAARHRGSLVNINV